MKSEPLHYPVAIVGGGPCGLLSALLLARQGVRCVLIERHNGLLDHPKAMSLAPRTVEIFRALDLEDPLKEGSLDMKDRDLSIWAKSLVGEELGRVPYNHDPSKPVEGLHCPQTVTERVLLTALEAEENASILFGHEALECSFHDEQSVTVSVQRRVGSLPIHLRADYLIAADGAASFLRRLLGIQAEGPGDQGHFLNVYFRAAYGHHLKHRRAVLYQALDKDCFEAFVAVNGDDLWLMHHFLQPGESPADYPADRLVETIQYVSGIPNEPVEILGISPWVMSPKVAHRFRAGRVLLVGDAAARLSPTGGLGMNTGLQSAHNLAWKLAAVLRGAPDSLLDTYETERRPVALDSFRVADKFRAEVFETVSAGMEGDFDRARELIAHSARANSPGAQLGTRYTDGALVFNPHLADENPLVGTLPPHTILRDEDDRDFPLSRWLGTEWTLIAVGQDAHWEVAAAAASPWVEMLIVRQIGGPGGVEDAENVFMSETRIQPGGAMLVRPDGFIAWAVLTRPENPTESLHKAFRKIFQEA